MDEYTTATQILQCFVVLEAIVHTELTLLDTVVQKHPPASQNCRATKRGRDGWYFSSAKLWFLGTFFRVHSAKTTNNLTPSDVDAESNDNIHARVGWSQRRGE